MKLAINAASMLLGATLLVSGSAYAQTEPSVQVEHAARRAIAPEDMDMSKSRLGGSLAAPENDIAPAGSKQARQAEAPKPSEVSSGPAVGDEIR